MAGDPSMRPGVYRHADAVNAEEKMRRLYWAMRLGIGFIWIWTAFVSWYAYPHSISIEWLRQTGFVNHTELVLAASCALDLLLGLVSCFYARRRVWLFQIIVVAAYSLVISVFLPEFLIHPFGPITENLAVLACLGYLALLERR
jgi:hypothetical protein